MADIGSSSLPSINQLYASSSPTTTTRDTTAPTDHVDPSALVKRQVLAVDVTTQFLRAASALKTGQLIKDESFTLFEAVSALEIMDPKMDNGLLEDGEALEDDYDVSRDLRPQEVIGIMDQILCYEVAWHMGYPLSQTLFTSVYVNRLLWPEPSSLEKAQFGNDLQPARGGYLVHKVLRAYCIGTIKACDFVHAMVSSQHYYEEEDFATQLFNRELLHRCDPDDVQVLLDEALSCLENSSLDKSYKSAIEDRLVFRQEFLAFLHGAASSLTVPSTPPATCLPLLQAVKISTALGTRVEESFSLKIQRTLASSVPPRPMVIVEFNNAILYLEGLCRDASDIYQLCEIHGNENLLTAYWTLMSHRPFPSVYVRALAQSFLSWKDKFMGRIPLKELVINDLESLVLPGSPILTIFDPSADTKLENAPQIAKLLTDFLTKCSIPYLNYFRTSCLNRCRIRRTLCHAGIEWDNLQVEAEEMDADLRILTTEVAHEYNPSMSPTYSYPLSSWLFHYKLLQLEQIVQLGFELSIYPPDEFGGLYWYLSNICLAHLAQLDRMSFFTEKNVHYLASAKRSGQTGATTTDDQSIRIDLTLQRLFRSYSQIKATEALARALHRLYTVLQRHHLVVKPPRPFSSNKLRHELRMRPFNPLSIPEPIPFETFEQETLLEGRTDNDVLDEASKAIMQARKAWEVVLKGRWAVNPMQGSVAPVQLDANNSSVLPATTVEGEWIKDVKDTLRSCIATSIAIETLKKRLIASNQVESEKNGISGLADLQVLIPVPGEQACYHYWWMVPKISV